jgi:hypothetical protein
MNIKNGFERAIYALNPATKQYYRSSSCTWHDDPHITLTLPQGWVAELEDTGMNSTDWDEDGHMTRFLDQHGVDHNWTRVSLDHFSKTTEQKGAEQ